MTPHLRFLELAAAGIDFGLSPSERTGLEAHLASCPVCARAAAAMRADAVALGHLPSVVLPERRGAEILAAAMHPPAIRHPLRLVLVAALLALLAMGSLVAGAELLRRLDEEQLVVVPPVATETPGPVPSASPAPPVDGALPSDVLIAYVGVEDGQRVIRTIRPDGSGARTIAQGERPAWSPDGTMLAFECPMTAAPADAVPATNICVANADGSGQRVVLTGARTPSWSPDGTRLLFGRSVIDAGDTSVVNLDGSGERWLGSGTGSWSPNGEWILLLGASGAEPDATIVHPDGTGARELGTCPGAAWSPDSTRVACTRLGGTRNELRTISASDGAVRTLMTERARISQPTWLTENRMLVMLTTERGTPMLDGGEGLFLVDFQTGERLLLNNWLTSPVVTSVAADGTWWAMTVGSDGSTDVLIRSIGAARTLTSDGTSMDAKWQPRPAAVDPSPAPAASDAFSSLYFQSVRVGSGDVAWATTKEGLYRTSDGGATWTEVDAPVANATVSVAPDAETLFLVTPEPDATVWVTHDAGRSWSVIPFPQEDGSTTPALLFPSPDHGFARFGGGKQPGARIYDTTDGGRTWTGPVVRSGPEGGMEQGGMAAIPGYEKGVLWRSNGKADDKLFDNRLAYSVDGGATWQEGRFPTGPNAPKNELKMIDGLWADGAGRVVLAMSLGDGPQLYVSDDGAHTWRFVRSWSSYPSGNTTVGYHVALLSGDEWILVAQDGSGSWSTRDGGASWREVSGVPTELLDEIYVASADRFYAVHRCDLDRTVTSEPDAECSWPVVNTDLLMTSDGGRTWTKVTN